MRQPPGLWEGPRGSEPENSRPGRGGTGVDVSRAAGGTGVERASVLKQGVSGRGLESRPAVAARGPREVGRVA